MHNFFTNYEVTPSQTLYVNTSILNPNEYIRIPVYSFINEDYNSNTYKFNK